MEHAKNKNAWIDRRALTCLGLGAASLATTIVLTHEGLDQKFERNLTSDGKCLEGSAFDPDNGAQIFENGDEDDDSIIVVPKAANFTDPSVLYLSGEDSFLDGTKYYPGDQPTEAYLQSRNC